MTKEQERKCFLIAVGFFDTAKLLNTKYNALLTSFKDGEGITGIPYDEFKNWLDEKINRYNGMWNRIFNALREGKTKEEVERMGDEMIMREIEELYDD